METAHKKILAHQEGFDDTLRYAADDMANNIAKDVKGAVQIIVQNADKQIVGNAADFNKQLVESIDKRVERIKDEVQDLRIDTTKLTNSREVELSSLKFSVEKLENTALRCNTIADTAQQKLDEVKFNKNAAVLACFDNSAVARDLLERITTISSGLQSWTNAVTNTLGNLKLVPQVSVGLNEAEITDLILKIINSTVAIGVQSSAIQDPAVGQPIMGGTGPSSVQQSASIQAQTAPSVAAHPTQDTVFNTQQSSQPLAPPAVVQQALPALGTPRALRDSHSQLEYANSAM